MMFTRPRRNVVQSDTGFSVEVLGQVGLKYQEGGKTIEINSEVLAGPSGMLVYSNSIAEWEGKPITEEKKQEILTNIREAFLFQGFSIDIA